MSFHAPLSRTFRGRKHSAALQAPCITSYIAWIDVDFPEMDVTLLLPSEKLLSCWTFRNDFEAFWLDTEGSLISPTWAGFCSGGVFVFVAVPFSLLPLTQTTSALMVDSSPPPRTSQKKLEKAVLDDVIYRLEHFPVDVRSPSSGMSGMSSLTARTFLNTLQQRRQRFITWAATCPTLLYPRLRSPKLPHRHKYLQPVPPQLPSLQQPPHTSEFHLLLQT